MRGHRDLELTLLAAVVCAAVAVAAPLEAIRIAFALPLTLLLPGWAIVAAAFGSRRLPVAQLLLLSLATSLATLALGALLLNALPGGIRTASWAALLLVVIVAACRVAAVRRDRPLPGRSRGPLPRLRPRDAALLGGGLALAVAALVLAQTPLPAEKASGYTALWMLPSEGAESVRIGVASAEKEPTAYELRVLTERGGEEVVRRLGLAPGEERELALPVRRRTGDEPFRVTASLYRSSEPSRPYRRVTTWIPSRDSFP